MLMNQKIGKELDCVIQKELKVDNMELNKRIMILKKLLINKLIEDKDPDKFIHCIWCCFTGYRFLHEEGQILKTLNNSYCKRFTFYFYSY